MQEFLVMLKSVIVFVLLAIPGYIAVKSKLCKSADSNVLSKIALYVAVPFYVVSSTLDMELAGKTLINLILVALFYSIFLVLIYFLAKVFIRKKNGNEHTGLQRLCLLFSNNGFIGLPLAEAVFGAGSIILGYIIVINVINVVGLMLIGEYMFTDGKSKVSVKKIIKSPVIIAFVLAIIINLIGVDVVITEVAYYSNFFKSLVTPLAMTILGMKFADVKILSLFTSKKLYYMSLLKLVVVPVIVVAIMVVVNMFVEIDKYIIFTMFIGFSTSTASLATSLADTYKVGEQEASLYVLGTTLYSVITLPILYALLCLVI